MKIKEIRLLLTEIRDNVPAIYEYDMDGDREYYDVLTEIIDGLEEYDR